MKDIKQCNSFEELKAEVKALFGTVDNNLDKASKQINELNDQIKANEVTSVEDIKATSLARLELEQCKAYYNSEMAKRMELVEDYSHAIYNNAQRIQNQESVNYINDYLPKVEAEAHKHWKAILKLDADFNDKLDEVRAEANRKSDEFDKYLNEANKQNLAHYSPSYSIQVANKVSGKG